MNKQNKQSEKPEKKLEEKDIIAYLENRLPEEKTYLLENEINDSAFFDEAMEGLQQIKNKTEIPLLVQDINFRLKKSIKKKMKVQIPQIFINNQLLAIVTTIAILLLVCIGFLLYKMYTSF